MRHSASRLSGAIAMGTLVTIAIPMIAFAVGAPSTARARAVASARHAGELPFMAGDLSRALTVARAKRRPIFIEAWAPW